MMPGLAWPLLILRPQPAAEVTAAAARARGFAPVVAPLFEVRACAWNPPEARAFDAILFTSANALRHGGDALARYRHLPACAVGPATAAAAGEAGFAVVATGRGGVEDLAGRITLEPPAKVLHLTGREHRAAAIPGVTVAAVTVYDAVGVDALPAAAAAALAAGAPALLHSSRAGALFATLVDDAMVPRERTTIVAISAAAAAAAGAGWRACAIAPSPRDDALLAAAQRMCEG